MRIGITTTVRAPVERVSEFVNYHLDLGVERIHLFFDDPDDPAIDAISSPRVTATRCDRRHWAEAADLFAGAARAALHERARDLVLRDLESNDYCIETRQILNATLALGRAREEQLDWLFHIDADELIYARSGSLSELMAGIPRDADVAHFPPLEALPEESTNSGSFADVRWFKSLLHVGYPPSRRVHRLHRTLGRLVGCHVWGEYFHGHCVGKAATRVQSQASCISVHRPGPISALKVHVPPAAWVLHFDCISFDEWLVKWRRRSGVGVARMMRPIRREEGRQFAALDAAGDLAGLRALYQHLYYVPASQRRRLERLKLLRRISLPAGAFEPARSPAG